MANICNIPIRINPCMSAADHAFNATALKMIRNEVCALKYGTADPIDPEEPQPINTPYLVVDLDQFDGATFTDRINQALVYLNNGGVLELLNQGDNIITSSIILSKPVTIYWPSSEFTFTGTGDMFIIESPLVNIYGTGRSPKASEPAAVTKFIMNSGRYHFYGKGISLINLNSFDCFGIKSADDENYAGTSTGGPLSGSGGIFLEKADPGTTSGGNNITGIFIQNIYIENTYAHGVYLDTPIISKLFNVRTSGIRGHGFYLNGGTSTVFESCFSASCTQAGFCLQSAAYCTLIGCASEFGGVGYWIRSVQGVSIFSSGGESNKNIGATIIPIRLETLAGDEITPILINDITNDFLSDFRGTTWLISGGQGISIFSPFSTNIGQSYSGSGVTNTSRHFKVRGNTRNLVIMNPRISINSAATVNNRFDWEFDNLAGAPSDVSVYYDPSDGTITPLIDSYFTSTNSAGNSTYVLTDTDDIVFYAGKQIFMSDDFDAAISLELGSGAGTKAPTKIVRL